ncbi:MAG: hypothetical protein Kow0088_26500 [Anaerolineales bacterium]
MLHKNVFPEVAYSNEVRQIDIFLVAQARLRYDGNQGIER